MAKKNSHICILGLIGLFMIILAGCARERPSERTPIHLNPNMDDQDKFQPQEKSEFFADSSAQRMPVPGTVAQGYLRNDDAFFKGMNSKGEFIQHNPLEINIHVLERGEQRYDIYCSPCHSRIGDGRGIMIQRNYPPPPSFHEDRLRNIPDGHLFDVITNGLRNMPSYRHQIPPDDRWAIVAYLRALQRSQNAAIDDVPVEMRDKLREVK